MSTRRSPPLASRALQAPSSVFSDGRPWWCWQDVWASSKVATSDNVPEDQSALSELQPCTRLGDGRDLPLRHLLASGWPISCHNLALDPTPRLVLARPASNIASIRTGRPGLVPLDRKRPHRLLCAFPFAAGAARKPTVSFLRCPSQKGTLRPVARQKRSGPGPSGVWVGLGARVRVRQVGLKPYHTLLTVRNAKITYTE